MTNAERFIGDEDLIDTFIEEFNDYACTRDCDFKYHYLKKTLVDFFCEEAKPTLTEDERTILRSMALPAQKFMLYRNFTGGLVLRDKDKVIHYEFFVYDKLFQFIKERRRILNRGAIKMNNKSKQYLIETREKFPKAEYITRMDNGEFVIEWFGNRFHAYTDKDVLKDLHWHTKYSIEELLK